MARSLARALIGINPDGLAGQTIGVTLSPPVLSDACAESELAPTSVIST
ncbi:MAG: hypothetical protein JOZ29_17445 [Deltaproteobacteria bacterium]|nr:hypothetical protein [Deltaproteobacteria bacterium]